jgi:GNAT superfamily N-acetyltransferase
MDFHTAVAMERGWAATADDIVCAREPLEAGDWQEKLKLIDLHAQELRGMASELQMETYRRLEKKDRLVIICARRRDSGELVGYSSHVWYEDLHFSLLTADDDAWFVLPGYRRLGIGRMLRETAHEELRRLGIRFVQARLKADGPHDELVAELGYRLWEYTYRKEL